MCEQHGCDAHLPYAVRAAFEIGAPAEPPPALPLHPIPPSSIPAVMRSKWDPTKLSAASAKARASAERRICEGCLTDLGRSDGVRLKTELCSAVDHFVVAVKAAVTQSKLTPGLSPEENDE